MRQPPNRFISPRRRGAILFAAMVCLLILSLVLGVLLQTSLSQRKQVRKAEQQTQAAWLAESALARAVQKHRADANYQQETWTVPAAELASPHEARVEISVKPSEQPAGQQITVRVQYPAGQPDAIQVTRQLTLPTGE